MASNYPSPPVSPKRLDDLLMCPVCHEGYKEPKTLACLHTFCTECLEHCRKPYRRDLSCPLCKKVTHLPALGVQGLQNDFRVQQIRDILINQGPDPDSQAAGDENTKTCDLCKTLQRQSAACHHCIQCFMYFCDQCLEKHGTNPLFKSHHVINMGESNATEVLFCRVHKEHPVRYFCQPCSMMLCTICTMGHEPSHSPEPLEKGIIEKYRKELHDSLKTIKSKLSEVKTKTKYLETIKETHQKALYAAQSAIKERTDNLVSKVRQQEKQLLQEVQNKIDIQMRENGIDNLCEIRFYRSNIETLYSEIQSVIHGSPQQCLVAYEDLKAKMQSIPDAPNVSSAGSKDNCVVKFVPCEEDLNNIIGTLQECSLEDNIGQAEMGGTSQPSAVTSPISSPQTRRRTASILSALSPGRKGDVKIGKVKAFNSGGERRSKSPRSKINADDVLRSAGSKRDRPKTPSSPSSVTQSPTSPVTLISSPNSPPVFPSPASPSFQTTGSFTLQNLPNAASNVTEGESERSSAGPNSMPVHISAKFRLVFKIDQVGQWPGKITVPSGIAFLPDGNLCVAECENRLQVFDRNGHSVRIIGWGKVQPQRVATLSDGKIAVTDRKNKCVKIYSHEGELVGSWGAGMFDNPVGIAIQSNGNYIITDVDRHMVSVHRSDGSLLTQFGTWGSGDYQFNNPSYVALDKDDKIYVSDNCNNCVKIFDAKGVFLRKFSISSSKQPNQTRRPQGITVANNGNIIVVERDNHRITLYSPEGKFMQHLLSKTDGLKYPCDVKLAEDNHLAVLETHSGFLTKDPHHCIKLFHIF